MNLDQLIVVSCAVMAVVCYAGYRYCSWNVRLKWGNRRGKHGLPSLS
jgi:hypothetical protein